MTYAPRKINETYFLTYSYFKMLNLKFNLFVFGKLPHSPAIMAEERALRQAKTKDEAIEKAHPARLCIAEMILLRYLLWSACLAGAVHCFRHTPKSNRGKIASRFRRPSHCNRSHQPLRAAFEDPEEAKVVEEVRLNVLSSRRNQIRFTLRNAEAIRNLRLKNGWVPELDEDGKPIKSDGKVAVTLTATIVAIGAVILRVGGRAALVSAVGLDFMTDNPELKQNLDQILTTAENMDPITKLALFTAAWTAVKVLCFDAAGVALALSAGILFGGVFQGAVVSAAAATFGSSVAFTMAKLDTPVRKKALEILDEYPSLRGIEKVVAQDGLKAIVTLRLAPVLPIPIGMYNYIYGVTNVPVLSFMGGIFLGSLKPYLLDSYLGYFGKELIDGSSAAATNMQDTILLVALGASVLIGVFASQLASETWDLVLAEVEAEKKAKDDLNATAIEEEEKDDVKREILGWKLPEWLVGFQFTLKEAELLITDLVDEECEAQVWNATKNNPPPASKDPAKRPDSREIAEANQGIDYAVGLCESLVLSPQLFTLFFKYADPLYDQSKDDGWNERHERRLAAGRDGTETLRKTMLDKIDSLRTTVNRRIAKLDELDGKERS